MTSAAWDERLTSNAAMEEDTMEGRSVEDSMEEIVTQVIGGRRFGHVRRIWCGLIPPLAISSKECSFTQIDNHDECRKRQEDIESELQQYRVELEETKENLQVNLAQTQKLQATVDLLLSRIGRLVKLYLCINLQIHTY